MGAAGHGIGGGDRSCRTLLATHDETVLDAAAQGRDADYAAALTILDDADAIIGDARRLRDRSGRHGRRRRPSTNGWTGAPTYDTALRELYDALRKSDGRVDRGGPPGDDRGAQGAGSPARRHARSRR